MVGLQRLCGKVLISDRSRIGDDYSVSAFDSELSLILWPSYRVSNYIPNPLRSEEVELQLKDNTTESKHTTFMVSRLDGPTVEIARTLVDRAVAAESVTLKGNAYIDARGIYEKIDQPGSFGYYDDKMRRLAEYLKNNTPLSVVLDDRSELFGIGECPNTILYCGWYNLRQYIDSFQFLNGAVGYHIASFEAETLRSSRTDKPDSNVWCKRMLENGITATLGAVAEPFLHSFPRPDLFFKYLTSGKYCLVECFYRAKPYNSWMMTLIGDPLYSPRYARSKGFRPVL